MIRGCDWNRIRIRKWRWLKSGFSRSQPFPAGLRHSANHHQGISADYPGELRSVVASEEPWRRHNPRGARAKVPRVPSLAAANPESTGQHEGRQLAPAPAEHDRRHLDACRSINLPSAIKIVTPFHLNPHFFVLFVSFPRVHKSNFSLKRNFFM